MNAFLYDACSLLSGNMAAATPQNMASSRSRSVLIASGRYTLPVRMNPRTISKARGSRSKKTSDRVPCSSRNRAARGDSGYSFTVEGSISKTRPPTFTRNGRLLCSTYAAEVGGTKANLKASRGKHS